MLQQRKVRLSQSNSNLILLTSYRKIITKHNQYSSIKHKQSQQEQHYFYKRQKIDAKLTEESFMLSIAYLLQQFRAFFFFFLLKSGVVYKF